MRKFLKHERKGFTLIEIILVLAILAVLIAFLVPNLMRYLESAGDTSDNASARLVYTSTITYAAENGITNFSELTSENLAAIAAMSGLASTDVALGTGASTSTAGRALIIHDGAGRLLRVDFGTNGSFSSTAP